MAPSVAKASATLGGVAQGGSVIGLLYVGNQIYKKMAPPLVTLLSSEPEIQYVSLRNINLIVQKRPSILAHEIKVFFCKYNDPIYVKMEKLEIIIRLVTERNIDQVLLEFKEYAQEVDVDFVRKSVRAIGRCAIKLDRAAERCINVLLELIQTGINYVVQEAVIVIKDIFRKYPNRYESIIATLCENLDTLDEPEAKASMIWRECPSPAAALGQGVLSLYLKLTSAWPSEFSKVNFSPPLAKLPMYWPYILSRG